MDNRGSAFDKFRRNSPARSDPTAQMLFDYEEHYMRLVKSYREEIKFINDLHTTHTREVKNFYANDLPTIIKKLETEPIADDVRREWLKHLEQHMSIVLSIVEGTFDKKILARYRDNQNIFQRYFALFVQFLTECGFGAVSECALHFVQYREIYSEKLSVPRFIDAAAALAVEIDLIVAFGRYCGMNEAEMAIYRQHALNSVEEIMQQNFKSAKESLPDLRFLHAIMQSIGTGKYNSLAASEAEYVADSASFIGFREDSSGTIWLRFDDAYNLVEKFYQRQNEQFLTTAKTIKEILLRKGLSDGKLMPEGQGGSEYLKKSIKPPRKWFLVLKMDTVEKFLEDNKEEI